MKKQKRELQFITEQFLVLIKDYLTGNDLCDATEWLYSLMGKKESVSFMAGEALMVSILFDIVDVDYNLGRIEWVFYNTEEHRYNVELDEVLMQLQENPRDDIATVKINPYA